MKALFSWLKEHIHIHDAHQKEPCDQIQHVTHMLTRAGFETTCAPAFSWAEPFQVALITHVAPHPNADTLNVCTVQTQDWGDLTVICGCPSVRAGLKVVLATPGCRLPGQKEALKASRLRGVESQGMLCSATELWVEDIYADDAAQKRIIHIPDHITVGTSFHHLLPADQVLHVEVTANRGDVGHHYGLAREMAALGLGTLITPSLPDLPPAHDGIKVNTSACSQIHLCTMSNINQGTTPALMRRRLWEMGVTCHFPCVDMTNYVAEDCGQPLHVFDADTLQGPVRVRTSVQGEIFHALDDQTYTLPAGAVVIEDDQGLLSLAGIMGGKRGSCGPDTRTIVLEAATFDPTTIGRTGRSVKIISQARHRFERGVDPAGVTRGLSQGMCWVKDHCTGVMDSLSSYAPTSQNKNPLIAFNTASVSTLGGAHLPKDTLIHRLENLGATVNPSPTDKAILSVTPPSWRYDWHSQADCVEEVLRMNGYEDVQDQPMHGTGVSWSRQVNTGHSLSHCPYHVDWRARRFCLSQGLYETVNWSFIDPKTAQMFLPKDCCGDDMTVSNPLSQDLSVMRPSIIPSLIKVDMYHKRFSLPFSPVFEMAPIFWGLKPEQQRQSLGMLFPITHPRDWANQKETSFYDVKGLVQRLLRTLSVPEGQWHAQGPSWLHPYQCAELFLPGVEKPVAWMGKIHPELSCHAWAVEIIMDTLVFDQHDPHYALPPLQPVYKDLSFFVPDQQSVGPVLQDMQNVGRPDLVHLRLVDVFKDEQTMSIAIEATFQPTDHLSFTAQQLHAHMDTLVQCAQGHGWALRGALPPLS